MSGPLDGITVLAAEQMHSLPHATQLLALMGAEVIKVEPPGGDAGRSGRPTLVDRDAGPVGSTFIRNNLSKSSVVIDLKSERGSDLFLRLAATVDVVAENFRPGTATKLGIAYDDVQRVNPRAVYVSISGFGNTESPSSPYREWAAYAPIVEGMAGLYEYSREPTVPPRPALAGALGDTAPGLYAVIGVLTALHERERTGRGRYVDISMYDSMIAVADVVHPASMGVEPSHAVDGIGILQRVRAAGRLLHGGSRPGDALPPVRRGGRPPRVDRRSPPAQPVRVVDAHGRRDPSGRRVLGRDAYQARGGNRARASWCRRRARQHRDRHPGRPARAVSRLRPRPRSARAGYARRCRRRQSHRVPPRSVPGRARRARARPTSGHCSASTPTASCASDWPQPTPSSPSSGEQE